MSTQTPPIPAHGSHRHTRSAALPTPAAASQNPQSPHYFNLRSYDNNSHFKMTQLQPTTPPKTPQKSEPGVPTQYDSQFNESDSARKPRPKGRNRQMKKATASPAVSRNDRRTPPLTGAQPGGMAATITRPISTPSAAAYAGPTFHASPAPSTLPIPSFYSKSVPDSPTIQAPPAEKAVSSNSFDSPTPPPAKIVTTQPQREESPLDFFFKADREEKERARGASSLLGTPLESGPFPPPPASHLSPENMSSVSQPTSRATHFSGGSTSALFAMELDGSNNPGKPYGPAFSTPYSERINAARSSATSSQSATQNPQVQQQLADRSEALKAYLFSAKIRSPAMTNSSDLPNPVASPLDQNLPAQAADRAGSNNSNQNSTWHPQKLHHSNHSYKDDVATSRDSPRGGSRSSGLRQEVTPSPTATLIEAPKQAAEPYFTPPSPSRHPRQALRSSTARTPGENSDVVRSASYNSATEPVMAAGNRSNQFKEMEDSLRRILKLEPAKDTSIPATNLGRIPEATASVPTYVGGRAPPMNGMHNGVMGS